MKNASGSDHVLDVVLFCDPRTEKDTPYVHVDGDVAAIQSKQRYVNFPIQQFDGHCRFLLADAVEALKTFPQLFRGRLISPDASGVAGIFRNNSRRGSNHPIGGHSDPPVERWRSGKRGTHSCRLRGNTVDLPMTKALAKPNRGFPRRLEPDLFVADHGDEEGEWVIPHERVCFLVRSETAGSRGNELAPESEESLY